MLKDFPRERCLEHGPHSLTLKEILAILIGSGIKGRSCIHLAESVLSRPGSGLAVREQEAAFFAALSCEGLASLQGIQGLGAATQARILAAHELGRRSTLHALGGGNAHKARASDELTAQPDKTDLLEKIQSIVPIEKRTSSREWLGFVTAHLRDGRPRLGELNIVENGVRTHVNMDPLELFARLLPLRPQAFYLIHNHPSGSLKASASDVRLTQEICRLADGLGVSLLGHVIVTPLSATWVLGAARNSALRTT